MQFDCDVLILGGGIQGLWLLNEISRLGYSSFLIDRPLGNAQSLHAQAFIQEGYLHKTPHFIDHLRQNASSEAWANFLGQCSMRTSDAKSIYGYTVGRDVTFTDNWNPNSLPFEHCDLPSIFKGGEVIGGFMTKEHWLDCERGISALRQDVKDLIRFGFITSIVTSANGDRRVGVRIAGHQTEVRPKAIVLAAGAGNKSLLDLVRNADATIARSVHAKFGSANPQKIRQSQIVVIRSQNLPNVACMIPGLSLYIVPRRQDNTTVWLVSFRDDPEITDIKLRDLDTDPPIDDERLTGLLSSLKRAMPTLSSLTFDFGVYTAHRVDGRRLVGSNPTTKEVVEDLGTRNLFLVWPSLMSLAPTAAKSVVSKLRHTIKPTGKRFSPQVIGIPDQKVVDYREKWKTVTLIYSKDLGL